MMLSISKNAKQVSRNYNIDIMRRILDALYEMGKSRITNIVVYARLNHYTAKRYLHLMNMLNWIEIEKEENHIVLCLTETGIFVHNQLHGIIPEEDIV
ncbi:MAG: hypothetical protein HY223_10430 [Thaumarchaeota archaeon]|nr:hypothetical protein [Nitrososphaerota archaeon]